MAVRVQREAFDAGFARHQIHHAVPLAAAMLFGGYELAAILGATIGARLRGVPVLLDGFVAPAAAAPLAGFEPTPGAASSRPSRPRARP